MDIKVLLIIFIILIRIKLISSKQCEKVDYNKKSAHGLIRCDYDPEYIIKTYGAVGALSQPFRPDSTTYLSNQFEGKICGSLSNEFSLNEFSVVQVALYFSATVLGNQITIKTTDLATGAAGLLKRIDISTNGYEIVVFPIGKKIERAKITIESSLSTSSRFGIEYIYVLNTKIDEDNCKSDDELLQKTTTTEPTTTTPETPETESTTESSESTETSTTTTEPTETTTPETSETASTTQTTESTETSTITTEAPTTTTDETTISTESSTLSSDETTITTEQSTTTTEDDTIVTTEDNITTSTPIEDQSSETTTSTEDEPITSTTNDLDTTITDGSTSTIISSSNGEITTSKSETPSEDEEIIQVTTSPLPILVSSNNEKLWMVIAIIFIVLFTSAAVVAMFMLLSLNRTIPYQNFPKSISYPYDNNTIPRLVVDRTPNDDAWIHNARIPVSGSVNTTNSFMWMDKTR